jgi:hypothetical protein
VTSGCPIRTQDAENSRYVSSLKDSIISFDIFQSEIVEPDEGCVDECARTSKGGHGELAYVSTV